MPSDANMAHFRPGLSKNLPKCQIFAKMGQIQDFYKSDCGQTDALCAQIWHPCPLMALNAYKIQLKKNKQEK